jgi:hypothetical protein
MHVPMPLFRDQRHAAIVGLALWGAGLYCLHDAWARRGRKPPFPVRMFASPPPGLG